MAELGWGERRSWGAAFLGLVMLATMLMVVPLQAVAQQSSQVGFRAHSFAGHDAEISGGAITGQKPESKLWFHDGEWWAAMLDPSADGAHTIHRLDEDAWVSTGVIIDERPSIKEDVLSLGNKLYILARANGDAGDNKLTRFTYASGSYSLDAGFPVTVPGTRPEAATLARDSQGNLWVTFERNAQIYVARTQGGDDTQWGDPFVIPVPGAAAVDGDDISAVISFEDATGPAIGVMWSNQVADKISFAVHRDGAADDQWSEETALSGALEANDHINMKTTDDQIFSVVKTRHTSDDQAIIRLLVRSPSGAWEPHRVALRAEGDKTRPIAVLHVDPSENKAYVFMTIDEGHLAEGIEYKATSLDDISFPEQSTPFIRGGNAEPINNATSMKANATAASGIVIMASDGSHYWWNRLGGSEPPVNQAPGADNEAVTTPEDIPVTVTLRANDPDDCELEFTVESQPSHGSLSALTNRACTPGDPNLDTARVTYTPESGFSGQDSFTFKANDGEHDSDLGTVTITVTETSTTIESESRTNLKHRGRPHRFSGRVKSDDERCVSGRKLVVKKVRPGKDVVVARPKSDANGKWSARHKRGGKGRYYAVVKGRTIQVGNDTIRCLSGRSATKRFGR